MKSAMILFIVLGLSLATWFIFNAKAMPLTAPEISFVTGFWLVVVLAGRWIWNRVRKNDTRREK